MKLSDYYQIINPKYSYLKMTPNNSLKNIQTDKIALSIASLSHSISFHADKGHLWHLPFGRSRLFPTHMTQSNPAKVSYYIHMNKDNADFFFVVPTASLSIIKEKIRSVWPTVTMCEVEKEAIPTFGESAAAYSMAYTQEDALSLCSDKRDDDLLSSTLNIMNVLEEDDHVGIFYNFIPTNQRGWRATYKATLKKVRAFQPTEKEKGAMYLAKVIMNQIESISNIISDTMSSKKQKEESNQFNSGIPSKSTEKKKTETIVDAQILIFSQSSVPIRQHNNSRSLAHSFTSIDELDGGNSLTAKHYRQTFKLDTFSYPSANRNKLSSSECQNLIALPGKTLLELHEQIAKTETQETQVPQELRKGVMCVGKCTFRGITQEAFLSTDKEYQQLCLVIAGPTRAGKTTLIESLAKDAVNNKECVVMFDFVKNCESSAQVAESFPDNTLAISCDNFHNLQGLGYNESSSVITIDPMQIYVNAKRQTSQLLSLINSVNSDNKELAPRMERFLTCASLLVFVQNGSIKDVFDVLTNDQVRGKYIATAPKTQRDNLKEYVIGLRELDDKDRNGEVIGTKFSNITNIIDRLQKLKANTYMEMMLKKGTENNLNLIDELQKPQLIVLQMPETMFTTDSERDTYTTYWMTKIWLAMQLRADKFKGRDKEVTKVNLVIDELYQVKHTEQFLTDKLSRLAKFKLKPIISCHYLNQIKGIRDELRSANASYMLISGCDKKNHEELAEELKPFDVDDLINLPRFHSMNLIKSSRGYERFITDLTDIGKRNSPPSSQALSLVAK